MGGGWVRVGGEGDRGCGGEEGRGGEGGRRGKGGGECSHGDLQTFFFTLVFPSLASLPSQAAETAGQHVNGLSSSLVFTPVQGIELANPNAAADKVSIHST